MSPLPLLLREGAGGWVHVFKGKQTGDGLKKTRTHPNPSLLRKEGLRTLLYFLQNNVMMYMSVCYENFGDSSLPLLFAKREGGRGDEFR